MPTVSSLRGTLAGDQLFSLLSYLKLTKATGRLELTTQGGIGYIFIQDGEVTHAESGDLIGDKAVMRISTWTEGFFNFLPNERSPKATITDSLEGLALSVAVAIDEGAVPPAPPAPLLNLDLPARLVPQAANNQVTFTSEELNLITRVGSRSTLREIALALDWEAEAMRRVAGSMIERGLLELSDALPVPSKTPTLPPAPQFIDARFIKSLREAYVKILGPAANFMWEDVSSELGVNPEALPNPQFSGFLRGLAGAIDDASAREQFIRILTQLRAQHRI